MTLEAISGRDAYRDALIALMHADPEVFCIDTDTGMFNGAAFGAAASRYLNVGIAEQNAVGIAAGLAAGGKRPFMHTMAAFAAARALEQIKIDVAYNRLPVRIVATHGGLSAGHLGPTHHALEDLAVMRLLPGMTVVIPANAWQTSEAVRQSASIPGPLYLRLGRAATPMLELDGPFRLGTVQPLKDGDDAVVFACGGHAIEAALAAREALRAEGILAAVANVHTLKPLDHQEIVRLARGRVVVTVEDHWMAGGLGGAIAELLSEVCPTFVKRIGVADRFAEEPGDHQRLLEAHGIEPSKIAGAVRHLLAERRAIASVTR